ncbi:hypothetical protein [Tardiphaga sp. vice278]|uniref:hypothetical protein n=1 Tax=Tardiphaga sp. vice278 TaxID=2592815 RepID=UPI0011638807|nr:hypothetical protein [Tardiphaga sp. vice278]QDM15180.1 hypothetical protein FNL53_03795 [Tardiphaga sp. vice278]
MTDDLAPENLTPAESVLVQVFFDEMHRIVLQPFAGIKDIPEAIGERKRFMEVMALLIVFLKKLGADRELTHKLSNYYASLRDLERGTTHPILLAKSLNHKPPLSSDVWRSRATLAIALDCLVAANVPLQGAVATVAKIPGIVKLLSSPTANVASSLKNWRNTLGEKSVSSEVAADRWATYLQDVEQSAPTDAMSRQDWFKETAKLLLDVAKGDIANMPVRRHSV